LAHVLPPATISTPNPQARRDFAPICVDVLRGELAALGIDELAFAFSCGMKPAVVWMILAEERASKASLRRIRAGLRSAWAKKVRVPGEEAFHHRRLTLAYLSQGVVS